MCSVVRIMSKIYIILMLFVVACSDNKGCDGKYVYIAHAGGAIDGFLYTNSREALENAAGLGYRYIEVDLQMTSDSVLVAAHSWGMFNEITGYGHYGDSVPSLDEFLFRRIYGRYTPITADEVRDFFIENDSLYLVTDKISNPKLLDTHFSVLKERMLVEAFCYEDYMELVESDYNMVIYSCMASDLYMSLIKHLLLHDFFTGPKIEWLALHTSVCEYRMFEVVDALCDYNAALFTINDTTLVPVALKDNVRMIYTDSIIP